MKKRKEKVKIQDNFLPTEEFIALRDTITEFEFPWHYSHYIVSEDESGPSPGMLQHIIYMYNIPRSEYYHKLLYLMEQMEIYSLQRIIINLNPRLQEPYFANFHKDEDWEVTQELIAAKHITSIFYINTNNGYTEFEDGTKIKSVANRLISFPLTTSHRTVTQTDTQTRIMINLNYLKRPDKT